jgi:hypothetical protein
MSQFSYDKSTQDSDSELEQIAKLDDKLWEQERIEDYTLEHIAKLDDELWTKDIQLELLKKQLNEIKNQMSQLINSNTELKTQLDEYIS